MWCADLLSEDKDLALINSTELGVNSQVLFIQRLTDTHTDR